MLANNNQAMICKLAKNSVKTNKKQYGILFFTILLSAFMLFGVLTTGLSYLDASRLQNTRLNGAKYDIATMNGFTAQQLSTLRQNKDVQNVGVESYAGFIKSTEFDDTAEVGLLWCDAVFWDDLMAPARTKTDGHYPQHKNELMVTKDILKTFGKETLAVGDSLTVTYENNTGVHTDEFTISGIWDGYGDTSAAFVSKAFYDETGYDLKTDGILGIKLNHNYVLPSTMQTIEQSMDLTERQIFAPTGYIENSFKLLLGIIGLAFIICLSAYLLIYNILYLSVSGKIRYYGLLQSLGMTKKQLVSFIVRQMLFIATGGVAIGILSGALFCIQIRPVHFKRSGNRLRQYRNAVQPGDLPHHDPRDRALHPHRNAKTDPDRHRRHTGGSHQIQRIRTQKSRIQKEKRSVFLENGAGAIKKRQKENHRGSAVTGHKPVRLLLPDHDHQ